MNKNFIQMLKARWAEEKFVCVGLDSIYEKIPINVREHFHDMPITGGVLRFNKKIIDSTHDLVCAYKPNIAFYERYGAPGIETLKETVSYIHFKDPEIPVILDYKRGDIGNTNEGYVKSAFEYFEADAVTVNPFLGKEAMQPFLNCKDKGIIILCKTSNKGSDEFQNLPVIVDFDLKETKPVYEYIAENVADHWNENHNCLLVVGATYPGELKKVRAIVGDMPILIPGIGTQGGNLEEALDAGFDSNLEGVIINSSSGIIYASNGDDFAEAARNKTQELHDAIVAFRRTLDPAKRKL